MNILPNFPNSVSHEELMSLLRIFNLIVAAFGALMMFRMKTETSTTEQPWTRHLGIALSIFALQYLVSGLHLNNRVQLLSATGGFLPEAFGISINFFLLSSARMLLNRRPWWPRWFFVLVAIDVVAVTLRLFDLVSADGTDLPSTLCRIAGDAISFITLMHFGYAAYVNTKFYKSRFGIVLGIVIAIIYGGIHLVSPFVLNIAGAYASATTLPAEAIEGRFEALFTFVGALFKLVVLYSAFLITTLETQTLITLHTKLHDSVELRKVFFSRKGILAAIVNAFQGKAVKLYIRIPVKGGEDEPPVHVYSSDKGSEYESADEKNTPIPAILNRLILEEKANRLRTQAGKKSFFKRVFRALQTQRTRVPFDGLEPIRYHGGLVGCLAIERKNSQPFSYSEERLSRLLSNDISALVQFYRVQESLRVLIEALSSNIGMLPHTKGVALSNTELSRRFGQVIQSVLSPLRTRFAINIGFVQTEVGSAGDNSAGDNDEAAAGALECKTVRYKCVTDEVGSELLIGHIFLDYQYDRDPVAQPSLGYFHAYGEAVASIVTRSFLASAEHKLNLIIRNLSLELTKTLDFDNWLHQIQASVREADLDGVVVYHPEIRDFSQFVRPDDTPGNIAVGATLANAFPDSKQVLQQLGDAPKEILPTPDRLVIGMKLGSQAAGLFVGVKRLEFAKELALETPWRNFLINLANVAGNSLERVIQAKQIQSNQIEQAEDYVVLSNAEKVGLLTHDLISQVENLAINTALLKLDLPDSLDEDLKKPIITRIGEMREEFAYLRSLTQDIRNSAQIPEQSGPCSLQQTLRNLRRLHMSRNSIEIELKGVNSRSAISDSVSTLSDVEVDLPAYIVELTFGNLIRNSIAAIKRNDYYENLEPGSLNSPGLIKIWAVVDEGEKLFDCFISDNGSGVSPEMEERIFDVNVSSTPGKGGWGLFYVKRKLERHGGAINLEHSEPGQTTFRVRLPRLLNKTEDRMTNV
jgi:signal transduction histidine kinase